MVTMPPVLAVQIWPVIAEHFDMPVGEPQQVPLQDYMRDKQPKWEAIVAKHGLAKEFKWEQLGTWQFAVSTSSCSIMCHGVKLPADAHVFALCSMYMQLQLGACLLKWCSYKLLRACHLRSLFPVTHAHDCCNSVRHNDPFLLFTTVQEFVFQQPCDWFTNTNKLKRAGFNEMKLGAFATSPRPQSCCPFTILSLE